MTKLEEKIPLGEVTGNYPTMKETGEFIRHARESHGISQETLGNKIFVTRKAVSKWETGVGYPSVEILAPLAEALNISIDEMLIGKFNKKEENSNQKGIINYIFRLSKRKYIRRTVKLILAMLFLLLAIFFVTNYNAVSVYKIGYASDDLYVQNGIIVTTRYKEYINIGAISNDFSDTDDNTEITYTLYIGDKNNIFTELQKFNINTKKPYISNAGYQEIPSLNISQNYDNLYMKINYKNIHNEDISFTIKLDVLLKYKSNDYFNYKKDINNLAIENTKIKQLSKEDLDSETYKVNVAKIYNDLKNKTPEYFNKINKNNIYKVTIGKNLKISTNENTYIIDLDNNYIRYKDKTSDKPCFKRIEAEIVVFGQSETKQFHDLIDILKKLEKNI